MKILIISEGRYVLYGDAFEKTFKKLGYEAKHFKWDVYFDLKKTTHKIQNKFLIGPILRKINQDILSISHDFKPDLVFVYRGTHVYPKTIKEIKKSGAKVFGYNNDDPFSDRYKLLDFRLWSLYKKSIFEYDWIFSYRWKNIEDYKHIGYHKTSLLRSYYIKDRNFYIEDINKKYDVIFIGHFEDDGRDETIKYLLDNDINIKLFGTFWHKSKYYNFFINKMGNIESLYGEEYNITINQAKIALVFLSKLNNDTYTRRCFEIPATKTMMLSEYTDDLAKNLFVEGKEAEYFRDKNELLEKIKFYLKHEKNIKDTGKHGYKRLLNDGHEVSSRCKDIIKVYDEYIN